MLRRFIRRIRYITHAVRERETEYPHDWHKFFKTHEFEAESPEGETYVIFEYTEYWYSRLQVGNGLTRGRVEYKTEDALPVERMDRDRFIINPGEEEEIEVKRVR
jgi:hypothetical protein